MNEDWNCLGEENKDPYSQICIEAVENDDIFNKFKKDPRYTAILEHVSIEQGKLYAQDILDYDIDSDLISSFKDNDIVGGSSTFNYGEPFGRISPSTLRYIQNALDISYFFGEGELNKIVEIGGGYGGLCKTINCLCDFGEYHIYDMDAASKLQKKYLSYNSTKSFHFFKAYHTFKFIFHSCLMRYDKDICILNNIPNNFKELFCSHTI